MEFNRELDHLRAQVDAFYSPPSSPMNKSVTPKVSQVISREEFMAKAMSSARNGHISARQVSEAELYLNAGRRPPERLVRAVIDGVEYSPFA